MRWKNWALCACVALAISVGCGDLPPESDAGEDGGNTQSGGSGGSPDDAGGSGGSGGSTGARDAGGDSGGDGGDGDGDAGDGDGGELDAGHDASTAPDAGHDAETPDATVIDQRPLGAACDDADECDSERCVDGVCCASLCGTCGECIAPSGTCVAILSGVDPDSCAAPSSCSLGSCVSPGALGALCDQDQDCESNECVDGVCCSTGSCESCESCALGGGVCGAVLNAEDPNGACSGNNTCDGAGACKLKSGQSCGSASACVSGACTDGVCCAQSCGQCEVCSGVGGTCVDVTTGEDPDSCTTPSYCTEAGTCFTPGALGAACGDGAECASGACVDGVCCTTDTCETCESCAAGAGTCTTITFQEDQGTCSGIYACDGAGACRLAPGVACEQASECGSDSCLGGHCCGESCSGTCRGCDASGACVPLRNQDGPGCSDGFTCGAQAECLIVDQQQLTPGTVSLGLNTGTIIAQTWIAGRSGEVVEIRVPLNCQGGVMVEVLVGPQREDGSPEDSGFAATAVFPGPRTHGALYAIEHPAVPVEAGDRLAVTMYADGPCGLTIAPFDADYYTGGEQYGRAPEESEWFSSSYDLMFQILMRD